MTLIWPWQDRSRRFSGLKAIAFALMFVPAGRLIYQIADNDFGFYPMSLGGLVYWSGVWATAILLLALAVTPAIRIFQWQALIDVRRMVGVTALVYTVAHIIIYFGLRLWNWSFIANEMITRLTLIVATLATFGLLALTITSLDDAIRRMGAKGWQRLHNTVYLTTALTLAHVLLSRGTFPEQYLMTGAFVWLMVWRVLDRYRLGADPRALLLLGIGSSIFAVVLELVLAWTKRGYSPAETFANNFSLDFGVPPVWQLLTAGLLVALACATHQAFAVKPARLAARKTG